MSGHLAEPESRAPHRDNLASCHLWPVRRVVIIPVPRRDDPGRGREITYRWRRESCRKGTESEMQYDGRLGRYS